MLSLITKIKLKQIAYEAIFAINSMSSCIWFVTKGTRCDIF
jgi:hypothetical protein